MSESRRTFFRNGLKYGLAAGGTAALLPVKSALGQICTQEIDPPAASTSPPTRPFVVPLPAMPVLQPVSALNPPPDPAAHQLYSQYAPRKFYEIVVREFQHSFHPDLPPTTVWGYGGMIPGPTIIARYGEPILVRIHNMLPADHQGWGLPSIATHLHNGHNASESDGFPSDFTDSGYYRDHHYPNFPAGNDPREVMSTLWYHDHRQDHTAENVVQGLSAFYLLFSDQDSGNERDPSSAALRLPSGAYDIPVILHDRAFDANGVQLFDLFNTDGLLGDKFTLNNVIQPFLQVAPRKYRFRFLNGGPSRFYQLFLSNGQSFTQLSADGNLLPAPLTVGSVILTVAERADVIIDFSQAQPGTSIYLLNRMEQISGRGPSGKLLTPGDQLMRFDVVLPLTEPDASQVPAALIPLPEIDLSEVAEERLWRFDYFNGSWLVNNLIFDENRVDATVKQGTAEIWTLRNEGTTWHHPIHIHFEEFQVIERNGKPIPSDSVEHARRDVARLGPGEEVKIFMRFRSFVGKYVMHCHNVVHEDHAMMVRYDVVP